MSARRISFHSTKSAHDHTLPTSMSSPRSGAASQVTNAAPASSITGTPARAPRHELLDVGGRKPMLVDDVDGHDPHSSRSATTGTPRTGTERSHRVDEVARSVTDAPRAVRTVDQRASSPHDSAWRAAATFVAVMSFGIGAPGAA